MSSQIGVVKYNDIINEEVLKNLNNIMSNIIINFKNLTSTNATKNRESELYSDYISQYDKDMGSFQLLRDNAQAIADLCNNGLYIISKRAIEHHIFDYSDETVDKIDDINNTDNNE